MSIHGRTHLGLLDDKMLEWMNIQATYLSRSIECRNPRTMTCTRDAVMTRYKIVVHKHENNVINTRSCHSNGLKIRCCVASSACVTQSRLTFVTVNFIELEAAVRHSSVRRHCRCRIFRCERKSRWPNYEINLAFTKCRKRYNLSQERHSVCSTSITIRTRCGAGYGEGAYHKCLMF